MNSEIILNTINNKEIKIIASKIFSKSRISNDEALFLYENCEISLLSILTQFVRENKNFKNVYFIQNVHIEPTNKCIHNCKFCSYSARISGKSWELSEEEILYKITQLDSNIRELHIVGGVHPHRGAKYYSNLLKKIRTIKPNIHIKAFTAVEIDGMSKIDNISIEECLILLKNSGLNSIPGGGAEIFDKKLREEICSSKTDTTNWLNIHRTAHKLNIKSNATMLYGFFENYKQRIEHLELLRNLQDETGGFDTFIPLKFKNKNNEYSHIPEVSIIEDIKTFAISRLYLDNFQHIKAYWPMLGIENAKILLHYGVDDLDGTINNSTKIYSMAGSIEKPEITKSRIIEIIENENFIPFERDALYNKIL